MSHKIELLKTGNFYLQTRLLGGFRVMIEVESCYQCPHDFSYGPEFRHYRKATLREIQDLGIKIG